MASVTFDHVYKKFGEIVAVNDFSLQIEDKEFLALIGPSGCGKVTLLSCLAGFEKPSSGKILISDRLVDDVEPRNRDIGMVFSNSGLEPDLSVYDNLVFPLKTRKTTKEQSHRLVLEVAEILDLTHLLQRKPQQLSSMQRQRVALGRAVIIEPKVLLFDNPLSTFPFRNRIQMRSEIHKLHQLLQTTFVYVTDDLTEAMAMSTRIVVMNKGRLQQVDTPQKIYDQPANLFVAGFISPNSMNFFNAKLRTNETKLIIDCGDFILSIPEEKTSRYLGYVGRNVIFGIRPNNIHLIDFVPPNIKGEKVNVKVDLVEFTGNELFLYLMSGKNSLVAQLKPHYELIEGQQIQVLFDADHFYLFDAETEEAI